MCMSFRQVVDHYENPRNVGSLDKNSKNVGTGLVGAPACGDVMKLQVRRSRANTATAPNIPQTAFFKTPCLTQTTLFRSKWTKTARLLTRDLKPSAVDQQLPPALWQPSGWRGSRWVGTTLAIKLEGGQWLHKTCLFIEELINLLSCCRLTRLWRSRTRTLPKSSAFLQSSYIALVSSQLHCTNCFVLFLLCVAWLHIEMEIQSVFFV